MTADILEQKLKKGELNSLYLLYGEEEFLLDTCVKKIKKLFGEKLLGINYIYIDESNVESLIQEIQTPAFGYPKKLIIVKNSGLFKKEKSGTKKKTTKKVKNLETYSETNQETKPKNTLETGISSHIEKNIQIINESVILVFIEGQIDKNTLTKTIEKYGIVCNFEELKPQQIAMRLKVICNAYKVNIDNYTMQMFIETCGTNMQILINELRKLIEYAGKNGTITKEAIDLLSIRKIESVIFDLTDNLGRKNIKQALDILNDLLYNKEPIQKILVTLYNHFKRLYLTSLALEENKNIPQSLLLKPNQIFLVDKYKKQIRLFNKNTLRKLLQELIDLDYNYKQGNINLNIGLEAILCTYCG